MNARTIFFDFDGVLFDTAKECLDVAVLTAKKLKLFPEFDEEIFLSEGFKKKFLEFRFFVGPPWQYAVLIECILKNSLPEKKTDFIELAKSKQTQFDGFENAYFHQREELSEDVNEWLKNVSAFEDSCETFKKILSEKRAYILSTRDRSSIQKIMKHFLKLDVASGAFLDRAGNRSKAELIQDYCIRKNKRTSETVLIDDYVQHLKPAHDLGVACLLAEWGYLEAGDLERCHLLGIKSIKLKEIADFEEKL